MRSGRQIERWAGRFLAVALAVAAAWAQPVPQLMRSLEEISGLKASKPVVQERMRREELRTFFEKRMKDAVKPEETEKTELALKKLGLVPQDFKLASTLIDLLSEQAAAFYDYERGKLVMLEGSSGPLEQMALVHELAHALADQHFKISRFLGKNAEEDEAGLARQAVVEGQAQWLMSEYMARQMGQSLLKTPGLVNLLSGAADASGQFPVYDESPLYLRESLVFPYSAGMRFQQAVVAELGIEGFKRVFDRPPTDSRQILHPDVYLHPPPPAKGVRAPAPPMERDWKLIAEGTVGEFDHQMLMKIYAPEDFELAAEWRAGDYRLWQHKKNKPAVALTYATRWADAAAAQRYFAAYRRVLQGKWPDLQIASEAADRLAGSGGGGAFELRVENDLVISLEGLPEVH